MVSSQLAYEATREAYMESARTIDGYALFIATIEERLQQGWYDQKAVDAIGQVGHWKQRIDAVEAYAFVKVWYAWSTNNVVATRLYIGQGPERDSEIDENTAILKRLPEMCGLNCEARFWGGTQDEDGCVLIQDSVVLTGGSSDRYEEELRPPTDWPLEVGSQRFCKTLMALNTVGKLARWPYGSRDIWLFSLSESGWQQWRDRHDQFAARLGL